ncbi:potassium transporter TrkA [Phenylobacterium sp. Root77]|jgi:CPA2 family monovalent cation:H+ antiporter-2|uniref:cation:proton antiporter domain-containing protein n=1 Tax=unclassified Phenylobacterium TaxID=2640670 RepID=UPI0006F1C6B4|nr:MULTISPECIES: cation:proton antiporter [unclassified Phenylobacterium]KQW71038.1 potassium transporter TrkA [Phenylobacterium sp. Root1277]KQW95804.1 potassium transporter TrkA [Phenylobacterium sp. Root1290]KRC41589.1 potassium transporter TrkA [Phenylobacterium sp. Root77]
MEGHVSPGEYKDVVLFLATAGVIVPLFRRWRISPILGFLGAGVVLGPFGLGALSDNFPWLSYFTIANAGEIAQLAEFGVVFLLFMIGLELSWERLRLMRRWVFGMGALQVTLCLAAIALAGMTLGLDIAPAVAIGAALALSSTAVVMQILTEHKRQHSPAGRATFSVLLFQDLAVAPILVTLAILGRSGDGEAFSPRLLLAFAPAALGVMILVAFGRLLLRPMLKSVARAKSEELFMAACLLVVIGAGLVSALTGLSMALGAFIAGLLLAETEYRHEVEVTIEPFKGLLLGLFFLSVGIGLDLSLLAAKPLAILGMSVGVVALNATVVFGLGRLFGLPWRGAMEAGLLLAGGGEFAYVILSAAMGDGIVPRPLGQMVLVSSTISMMCIPLLAALGLKLGGRKTGGQGLAPDPVASPAGDGSDGEAPKVLVVGYGRVGKLVGDMLHRHDIAWVAAERDPKLVEAARHAGEAIYFGDASRPEFLRRCGLETAPALVVTMDSPDGVEAIVATARAMRPDLTIVARARDARQAQRLYELGATDAVPETVEASLQLSEAVLVEIGVPMGLIIASIHERRDEYRKALNRPEALGGRVRRYRRAQEN